MKKIGIVGFRGMVGSTLLERMNLMGDFKHFQTSFFSSSLEGELAPQVENLNHKKILSSVDLKTLQKMDIIITCQGSEYSEEVLPQLRKENYLGYWIDASSSLRLKDDSIIVLDPINDLKIKEGLSKGIKNYVGGNCTVSLMLMALSGLVKEGVIEWVSSMTYQAASGAGAKQMEELMAQMKAIGTSLDENFDSALLREKAINKKLKDDSFPKELFRVPLAGSLIPFIDSEMGDGSSKEEWKGGSETNKILGPEASFPVDGICVRVGSFRAHAQALTIKLKDNVPLERIEEMIRHSHEWIKVIPNNKKDSEDFLNPVDVSGTTDIRVGRLKKLSIGEEYLGLFTVADQLIWGAAEPLRRVLRIIGEA